MRRTGLALFLVALLAVAGALAGSSTPAGSQGPPQGGPGGPGGGRPPGMMGMAPDSFAAERDSLTQLVMQRIAGRENAPAESVFRNIKVMKGRSAKQVLGAMNACGRSLGVSCKHCHVENHWGEEDKKAKQITRDMMEMTGSINDTLLARVFPARTGDDSPHVGCFTCHRGHTNPGWRPGPPPGQGQMGQPGGPGGPGGQKPQGGGH